MAKRKVTRKRQNVRRTPRRATRTTRSGSSKASALFAPIRGAERRDVGGVRLEVTRAGAARVKRMIYPVGFRWSVDMKPLVGTALCAHAHVGFLAHGRIRIEYEDGCRVDYKAPQIVAIDPGHDGVVIGQEPAVLIEFDFERDTVRRLEMPDAHRH